MHYPKPTNSADQFLFDGGEVGKLIRSRNWSTTSLGDLNTWPQSLSTSVNICINSKTPMAIWWGKDLVLIYNDSFSSILAKKHPSAFGSEGKNVWHEVGRQAEIVLTEAKATISNDQKILLNQNGIEEERHFRFAHSPIYDESGKVAGVFTSASDTTPLMYGTTWDITEQKNQTSKLEKMVSERTFSLQKKNEELKRSEERYHKMTDEVQDYAIILLDKNGTILNWNLGAEKIKGYKQEEILGKSFKIFYLDHDRKNMLPEKLINEAVQNGRAMQEGFRKRKDGSAFWGSIVITALHDDQNNIIGFSKVTRDLTERKEAEDKMKQYTSELVLRNRELEQFAYIASHDLQEPLRKIKTFADVLEKNLEDPETRQKYFAKIQSSARRMSDLITSVLNYSRLANSESLFEETDLNILLENVKADYELLIEEKKATIVSDILPTIQGLPLQLSQLFANLIGNSLKFSEVNPVIQITSTVFLAEALQKKHPSLNQAEKYVELIFRDNGIGFEQQYADKIFAIFQRLNRQDDYAGTGIGLALCKKVVDNHKGYIEAKSHLGTGAEFYIYLPLP